MAGLQPTQSSVDLLANEKLSTSRDPVMAESAARSESVTADATTDVSEREEEDESVTEASEADSSPVAHEEVMLNEAGPAHEGKRVKVGRDPSFIISAHVAHSVWSCCSISPFRSCLLGPTRPETVISPIPESAGVRVTRGILVRPRNGALQRGLRRLARPRLNHRRGGGCSERESGR